MAKKTLPTHPAARSAALKQREPAAKPLKKMPPPPTTKKAAPPAKGKKGVMHGRPVAVPDRPKPTQETQGTLALALDPATATDYQDLPATPTGTYLDHSLLADLPELLAEQQRLLGIKKAGEEAAKVEKELRANIEGLLLASDVDDKEGVTCGPYKVTRQEVEGSWKLDETLLLEAGVPADMILEAKVQEDGYSFAKVTRLKDRG